MPLPNSLWDLFEAWPVLHEKSLLVPIWKCSPSLVVWALWWERNKRIFRKEQSTVSVVTGIIEKSISELVISNIRKRSSQIGFSNWDNQILKDWKLIYIPNLLSLTNTFKKDRFNVKWHPPDQGVIKLNFDGASHGNPGLSGIGVCLRNHLGIPLFIKSSHIPWGTNNNAEVSAFLLGLVTTSSMKIPWLQVEGDSLIIIQGCITRQIQCRSLVYKLK